MLFLQGFEPCHLGFHAGSLIEAVHDRRIAFIDPGIVVLDLLLQRGGFLLRLCQRLGHCLHLKVIALLFFNEFLLFGFPLRDLITDRLLSALKMLLIIACGTDLLLQNADLKL